MEAAILPAVALVAALVVLAPAVSLARHPALGPRRLEAPLV